MDVVEFGRYRLISLIGEGGMGKVYKAHDTVIGREVAIKVLPSELGSEPGYRERFSREAHTVARLTEPHIIPIYDTGEIEGRMYLVMPVIDGIDVHSLLKRDGPMNAWLAVKVIEQIAAALDTAHAHGLVHRDVKPSNALMTSKEFVYLIDFGIAHDAAATRLTRTDTIVGTFAYMAPERFRAGTTDARADVYALACVLHECLTGDMPYRGESLEQLIAMHLTREPPQPTTINPAVPASFDAVVALGMAKSPDERYQTASELAAAARRALDDAPAAAQSGGLAPVLTTPAPLPPPVATTPMPPQVDGRTDADANSKSVAHVGEKAMESPTSVLGPPEGEAKSTPIQAHRAPEDFATTVAASRVGSVRELVTLRSASMPFAIAAVLALAAVAVALIGLGAPPPGGDLPPGTVTIAGVDPTRSGEVTVDLSKPIPVTLTADNADSITLALDILGAPVGHHEASLAPDSAGRDTTLPAPVNRYLLAGRMTAQITVLRDHTPLGSYRFTMSSTQPATTTVAAAATVVLALLAGAYIESNLRVLRRGRESPSAVVAVPLFAAALAVAAVAAAWILLGHPPTVATLVWSAGLAGAAGFAAVIGANRVGRRRYRRPGRAHT